MHTSYLTSSYITDFGIENLLPFMQKTNFPWLMSNVLDIETNRPLADAQVTHIVEAAGKRVI
jgi:putative 5'-nucleotidase (fragment)